MNTTENKRKHADWQDSYRRSSNFPSLTENETEKLKIKGSGKLKLKKNKTDSEE